MFWTTYYSSAAGLPCHSCCTKLGQSVLQWYSSSLLIDQSGSWHCFRIVSTTLPRVQCISTVATGQGPSLILPPTWLAVPAKKYLLCHVTKPCTCSSILCQDWQNMGGGVLSLKKCQIILITLMSVGLNKHNARVHEPTGIYYIHDNQADQSTILDQPDLKQLKTDRKRKGGTATAPQGKASKQPLKQAAMLT